MRLPNDRRPLLLLRIGCTLTAVLALGACSLGSGSAELPLAAAPANGPQADYPVILGEPYTVAGTSYTPEDVLNYDHVGYVAPETSARAPASAAT